MGEVTIDMLWVYDESGNGYRATVADLVSALTAAGVGEVVTVRQDATGSDAWPNLKTGRYLVVPLGDDT